jgi:hypothetical protein
MTLLWIILAIVLVGAIAFAIANVARARNGAAGGNSPQTTIVKDD